MSNNIQEINKKNNSLSWKELSLLLKKKNKSIPTKFLYDDMGSKLFEKISGLKLNYTFSSRRPGDVDSAYADSTKANKILGWVPELSLLDGLLSAWEWEQNIHR